MNDLKYFPTVLCIALVLICLQISVSAQSVAEKGRIATMTGGGQNVRWDVNAPHSELTLTISSPDGQIFRKQFSGGAAAEFRLTNNKGERLPDGQYTYELRLTPSFSSSVKEALTAPRAKGNADEVQRDLRKRGMIPAELVQSGEFLVSNGSVIVAGMFEEGTAKAPKVTTPAPQQFSFLRSNAPVRLVPVRRNHAAPFFDQVIPDDLIVQGSICAGLDCVNNENFGFDTIRVKENNTRIQFDDTSTSAGFATNNWQIRANNSASGGGSFLGFVDQGPTANSETGTIVFQVDAGAPANALRVSSSGNVGIGTAVPVLDVHANTSDTPAMRLEQNNTGGFSAQTWDVAGNEANFFIRDVTSGSRLPFRIRPGAPTSSVDIAASGNVGIGTGAPNLRAEVLGAPGLPVNSGTSPTGIARFSTSGGVGVIDFGFGGATGFGWLQATSSASLATNFGFLINPNGGNVGIGTTAPTDTLSVNGTASKPGGGTWAVFSDKRLKNVKGNFTSGLNTVMQLQPIRYEYRRDNSLGIKMTGEQIGFSAQEVQKVLPQAVVENSEGYLMVNSDPILWTMLNAIKEQQKQIEELKREVKQLRSTRRRR